MQDEISFVRWTKVIELTGLPQNTIRDLVKAGKFPAPVPLAARSVGFVKGEVDAWMRDRIAARGGQLNGR
ncbi:AlpA family phage regulatory protein [Aurantimonas sp. C2-6-R+9]|uniref:helix-turn-helix transcriptional regulator n=1 Tax=unclassified Aurantimonas TaxID=2638230 RepID=UPI002E18CA11|nr:AlpA family phage regulatory protein [Aurantimonas sp. C2-6-R+9]